MTVKYLDPKSSRVAKAGWYVIDDDGRQRGGPFADAGRAEAHKKTLEAPPDEPEDNTPVSPSP